MTRKKVRQSPRLGVVGKTQGQRHKRAARSRLFWPWKDSQRRGVLT